MAIIGAGVSDITIRINEVERSFSRMLEMLPKEAPADVLKPQLKGTMKTVVSITPPGSKGVKGVAAKKRGVLAVRRDVNRIFTPTRSPKRVTAGRGQMPAIHKAHKRHARRGIYTMRPAEPVIVLSRDLTEYRKEIESHVGRLAGGWQAGANALGLSLSKWISRHNTPGRFTIEVGITKVSIRITNASENIAGAELDPLILYALRIQENKMKRQLAHFYEKQAMRAGLRVR